jgi:uncharacterized delta-60 repeat protein
MLLHPNGRPDNSFGVGGKLTITIKDALGVPMFSGIPHDVAIQADGKILIGGEATFNILVEPPGDGLGEPELQQQQMFAMARLAQVNGQWQLDSTFDGDGTKAFVARGHAESIEALALLPPDGMGLQKILAVGGDSAPPPASFSADVAVIRLEPDGSLDTDEFASEPTNQYKGIRLIDFTPPGDVPHSDLARDVVLQQVTGDPSSIKIVVFGSTAWEPPSGDKFRDFIIARICSNGDPDTGLQPPQGCGGAGFGNNTPPNGKRNIHIEYNDRGNAAAIQNVAGEERIIVAGTTFIQDPGPPPLVSPNFMVGRGVGANAAEPDEELDPIESEYPDTHGHGDFAWDIEVIGCIIYVGGTHTATNSGAGTGVLGLFDTDCLAGLADGPRQSAARGFTTLFTRDGGTPTIVLSETARVSGAGKDGESAEPIEAGRDEEPASFATSMAAARRVGGWAASSGSTLADLAWPSGWLAWLPASLVEE